MESSNKLKTRAASLLPLWLLAFLLPGTPAGAAGHCPVGTSAGVQVGAQTFRVEVAESEAARARGLSGRANLPADSGLWFVLPAPGYHGFWMQDMAFPIDLVWISPERVVLGARRLTPCGPGVCPIHYPPAPAAYVLEVNADRFAGKPGDRAEWLCLP